MDINKTLIWGALILSIWASSWFAEDNSIIDDENTTSQDSILYPAKNLTDIKTYKIVSEVRYTVANKLKTSDNCDTDETLAIFNAFQVNEECN